MLAHTKTNSLLLTAVTAAMLVVAVVYLTHEKEVKSHALHQQGVALARLLSSLDWTTDERVNVSNIQRLYEHQLAFDGFAYGAVTDQQAQPIAPVISKHFNGALPALNTGSIDGWLNQRTIRIANREVVEYFGIVKGTGHANPLFFRIGLWAPSYEMQISQVPTLAILLLPTCLLLPLLWFVVRRTQQPIIEISSKLSELAQRNHISRIEVAADGELKGMMEGFNRFFQAMQERLIEAEYNSTKLLTQEKFLTYRAERFESILQTMPDGILILDEDYKVAFVNQHIENALGVNRLDVVSTTLESWCQYQPLVDYVRELKRDSHQVMSTMQQMADPNNPNRTLGLTTHPLFFPKSPTSHSGLLILLRDVSQEVAAKRSRAEFVGSVSHEVKAPLNTIGLYAQMLNEHIGDREYIIEAQNTITSEVERMTRLIHNLLSVTQIEMGSFDIDEQRTSLVDVVTSCIESLDHNEARGRIKVQSDNKIPAVMIDKDLFSIAVTNLLTNALKYSDDEVLVEVEESADAISIRVCDKGPGIDPIDQERIFDKFYRSSDEHTQSKSGHGLGLSISREIVSLHHGSLSVQSTPGQGTTFSIDLWKTTGIVKQAI